MAMSLDLRPHPGIPPGPVQAIRVEVERRGSALAFTYALAGAVERIRIPSPSPAKRAEDLWRHTCFEAFLRAPGEEAYFELNFSPSGEWAAYRFEGYRSGRTELDIPAPSISGYEGGEALVRFVSLEGLPSHGVRGLGLSAVVEDAAGGLSYWALAHPPGDPDFHHPDCFAVEFPAASI
jgi:hypothetical protein